MMLLSNQDTVIIGGMLFSWIALLVIEISSLKNSNLGTSTKNFLSHLQILTIKGIWGLE